TERRDGVELLREQVNLPIVRIREHVDELNRGRAVRWNGSISCAQVVANARRQAVEDVQHQVELTRRLAAIEKTETQAKLAEDVRVRTRFADSIDDRSAELDADGSVRLREVVPLEKRRRREQEIGEKRCVRHDLLEHHSEEVLSGEPP